MGNERIQTVRQEMIDRLIEGPVTIRDLSQSIGIMEKDVGHHLESVEKSIKHQNMKLIIEPYYCMSCGFEFHQRKKIKKPGKCPECRKTRIAQAVFQILPK